MIAIGDECPACLPIKVKESEPWELMSQYDYTPDYSS
jgi:hypothetical protein